MKRITVLSFTKEKNIKLFITCVIFNLYDKLICYIKIGAIYNRHILMDIFKRIYGYTDYDVIILK